MRETLEIHIAISKDNRHTPEQDADKADGYGLQIPAILGRVVVCSPASHVHRQEVVPKIESSDAQRSQDAAQEHAPEPKIEILLQCRCNPGKDQDIGRTLQETHQP